MPRKDPQGSAAGPSTAPASRKSASRGLDSRLIASFGGVASLAAAIILGGVLIKTPDALALPSFARQTGQPCATCHTAFPQLTPYGRRFKLMGYTTGGGLTLDQAPPISLLVLGSFTHTQDNQDSPPTPFTHTNNNPLLQQVSGFYAGQIWGNLGGFIQGTYDGASQHVFLDASDVRYVDTFKFLGFDVLWGLDANNTPTVEDVWNTTPRVHLSFLLLHARPSVLAAGNIARGRPWQPKSSGRASTRS